MNYFFSTINLYFCRVFLIWFGTCTLIIGAVISLFEGTELARRSIGKSNIDMSIVLEMILLKFPNHFQVLLPFIVLTAAMVTFYRLNHTQEIVAARSAGLSIWQILGGLCTFSLLLGLLQLIVINPLGAATSNRLQNLDQLYFSGSSNRISITETGLWLREVMPNRQSIIRTEHIDPQKKAFYRITFHNFVPAPPSENDQSQTLTYSTRIDAASAYLSNDFWVLHDATLWHSELGDATHHSELKIPTTLTIEKIKNSNTAPETISFWSLSKFIDILDKSGLSSLTYRLYWHGQLSKLGMMIAMILLAASFGIRPVRQGKTIRFVALGIGSGFFLYFMNDIVYALGLGGHVPILLAAWTPTLMMGMLSTSLLLHHEDG